MGKTFRSLSRFKKSKVHPNYLKGSHENKHFILWMLLQNWIQFCDITKLAGLSIVGGHRNSSKFNRIVLFTVWLLCLTLCIYKSIQSLDVYFKYEVKTSITFNTVAEQPFPAITLCNANMFRKSALALDDLFTTLGTQLLTGNYENNDPMLQKVSMLKWCSSGLSHPIVLY